MRPYGIITISLVGTEVTGYFHWLLGADVSSPAAICAYFQRLIVNQGQGGWLQGGKWHVSACTYCTYNPFSQLDVRVEMTVPGNATTSCVDCEGNVYEVDQQMWDEVMVASFLLIYQSQY